MPRISPFTKLVEAKETVADWREILGLVPNTDVYAVGGTDVAIADGGTGASTAATGFAALAATSIAFTGDITPTALSGDVDNYEPTGIGTAAVVRISSDAFRIITGIAGGTDGRILILHNVGGFSINLQNDTTSSVGNRFLLTNNITLSPNYSATLQYDATAGYWRCIGVLLVFASASVMETATSTINYVTPANHHRHPASPKVWVQGTPNSTTIISSYNVTSLGDTAAGQQTVTIATDFSGTAYCVLVTVGDTSTTLALSATVMTKAAGSYIMNAVVEAGSGADPVEDWNSVALGDQ